jgi:hypothetical protein
MAMPLTTKLLIGFGYVAVILLATLAMRAIG